MSLSNISAYIYIYTYTYTCTFVHVFLAALPCALQPWNLPRPGRLEALLAGLRPHHAGAPALQPGALGQPDPDDRHLAKLSCQAMYICNMCIYVYIQMYIHTMLERYILKN